MANYKNRRDFPLLVDLLEMAAKRFAAQKIPDAKALVVREKGLHNLQGHAMRVMPLAVWLAIRRPDLLKLIRGKTKLATEMKASSSEARAAFWGVVKDAIQDELSKSGADVLTSADKTNTPTTAQEIANTYLSADSGGGQTKGGAGNTVLKRSLKLLAHILPS
jgi:hypothetical protein